MSGAEKAETGGFVVSQVSKARPGAPGCLDWVRPEKQRQNLGGAEVEAFVGDFEGFDGDFATAGGEDWAGPFAGPGVASTGKRKRWRQVN